MHALTRTLVGQRPALFPVIFTNMLVCCDCLRFISVLCRAVDLNAKHHISTRAIAQSIATRVNFNNITNTHLGGRQVEANEVSEMSTTTMKQSQGTEKNNKRHISLQDICELVSWATIPMRQTAMACHSVGLGQNRKCAQGLPNSLHAIGGRETLVWGPPFHWCMPSSYMPYRYIRFLQALTALAVLQGKQWKQKTYLVLRAHGSCLLLWTAEGEAPSSIWLSRP
jgi:hypothetical protein